MLKMRLVRGAAAHVVSVAAFAVIDGKLRRGGGVRLEPVQQRNAPVVLPHQDVAQLVRQGQRAQRADGIDEQRMRAVEGINEAAAVLAAPSSAGPASRR